MTSKATKLKRKNTTGRPMTDSEHARLVPKEQSMGFGHDDCLADIETPCRIVSLIRGLTNDAIAEHVKNGQYTEGIVKDVKDLIAEGLSLEEILELLTKTHIKSFDDVKKLELLK